MSALATAAVEVDRSARTYFPTERDATRAAHIGKLVDRTVGTGSRPYYDSVVIVGAGFSASVMAARLARSEQFHGRVVMAGPRTEESRRLKDGATLRGHGTDYICYALDVPHYAYVDALYGDIVDGRGLGTRNQVTMARKGSSGAYEFSRVASFQGGKKGSARPLFYGARNSRMQAAIYELMDRDGLIEVPETVSSLDEAFSLALGRRPLIVNASHNSGILSGKAANVDWATSAVQAPLKVRPGGFRTVETNASLVATVRRRNKVDVGLFNPYGDPLSPSSTFYGIIVGQVSARAGYDKQQELDEITEELYGVADALGMDVDDADETLAAGMIPGAPWKAPASPPGSLELQLIAHQGVSATFSDGMTTGASAAVAAAEAVIRGLDPDRAARRAVREVTRDRRIWNIERNRMGPLYDLFIRTAPGAVAYYPFGHHAKTTWASAA
ncbi:hypothetical protein D0Z08_15380 [Nocardioides immobilis]|uniref:FAD-dependent oxidoreductase n=1 Tax=Nocardioides immobilis TaxID=2049295 RepID=A0A417Y169_9ACTN|nr:hypothetical protein [Nocardioides immobilis]RHW26331.1 hypothetical protein D0Z08_15380 [Nocardioides immobilis]